MIGYTKIRATGRPPWRSTESSWTAEFTPGYRRAGVGTRLVVAGIEAVKVLHAPHHPMLKLVIDVHKAGHIAVCPDSWAPATSSRSAITGE